MDQSYERRALLRYRLRGCQSVLWQRGLNGSEVDDVASFLPPGLLEVVLDRMAQIERNETTTPMPVFWRNAPETAASRTQLVAQISQLAPERKAACLQAIDDTLKLYWRRGNSKELSLYFSTHVLLLRLQRIARRLPSSQRPCVVTLEDDAVPRLTLFHPRTLRQLCTAVETGDAWQLMWHRVNSPVYRRLAKRNRRAYDTDAVETGNFYCTEGMLWKTDTLDKKLVDLAFDDAATQRGVHLNCQHWDCVTDHFYNETTDLKVPIVPWMSNPISDQSTGLHENSLTNHRIAIRASSAAMFMYEYQSFGSAVAIQKHLHRDDFNLGRDLVVRAQALQMFQADPAGILGHNIYDNANPGRWIIDVFKDPAFETTRAPSITQDTTESTTIPPEPWVGALF